MFDQLNFMQASAEDVLVHIFELTFNLFVFVAPCAHYDVDVVGEMEMLIFTFEMGGRSATEV